MVFVGKIKNYQYEGQGELRNNNTGTTMIKDFKNGILEGWGIIEDEYERFEGQIYSGKRNGFGNSIKNGKCRKSIWKDDRRIHQFYEYHRDEQICDICFCDFGPSETFPACSDDKCDKVLCLECMKSYYDKKKGCQLSEQNLLCIFCRKMKNITVLKFLMDELFGAINKNNINNNRFDFFNLIKSSKVGWCKKCDFLELLPKLECVADGGNKNDYLCGKCGVGNAVHTKGCPHCRFQITRSDSKRDGCHYIRCPKQHGGCGHAWCWFCLAKLDDNHHRWKCAVNNCDNQDS